VVVVRIMDSDVGVFLIIDVFSPTISCVQPASDAVPEDDHFWYVIWNGV
jgi:hypothetical protein